MSVLELKDIESFKAWATMLVKNETYEIPEAHAQVNFYGEGDGSYLVINVYTSDTTAIIYVFLAADEKDEDKAIIAIFDFLRTVGYSLHALLTWLSKVTYTATDMGDKVFAGGVVISRTFQQGTNATILGDVVAISVLHGHTP